MRRLATCSAVISLAAMIGAVIAPAVSAAGSPPSPVSYRPPVDAPVVDPFRPPPQPWAAGNRGVDYATTRGQVAAAAAPGDVVFAGSVGGSRHVVVLHADGVRTSYSFLDTATVRRGDAVAVGQAVGTTRDLLHFGARIGGAYVDPTLLFGDGTARVHLVPIADRPHSESEERAGLFRMLERTVAMAFDAAASGFEELEELAHYVGQTYPLQLSAMGARVLKGWWDQRGDCTSGTIEAPKLEERRILVLVAGLGSGSSNGAAFEVDHLALGFAASDVARFSYRGGRAKENPYGPADTVVDIRQSARRLRELLVEVAAANPGVPVDVVAHSQGGLVARWALTEELDGLDPRLPRITTLVTLGTPHHGADGATASALLGHTVSGRGLQGAAEPLLGFDPGAPSVKQLAETSEFISRLDERPLPPGVNVTSIGARGDLIVPAMRTHVDGARNVVVAVDGGLKDLPADHDRLPSSPAAHREIALALAGLPPTCQGLFDALADGVVSEGISLIEDGAGVAAWAGARSMSPVNLIPVP